MILIRILNQFLLRFNLGLYYKDNPIDKIKTQEGYVFKVNSPSAKMYNELVEEFNRDCTKKTETPKEYRQN